MKKEFKAGTLFGAVPPVMVSCGDMKNPNIITIGWTGIVNTKPPTTYISIRPERHSYDMIKKVRNSSSTLPQKTFYMQQTSVE